MAHAKLVMVKMKLLQEMEDLVKRINAELESMKMKKVNVFRVQNIPDL